MKIAVIPARGGSKRIPRKNIKLFCGKPMIAYAIEAAQKSGLFDHVVVSTDDQEIAQVAQDWGAEVPFIRPAALANDYTGTTPVIAQAIAACQEIGWAMDYVCCIYPCVPLIEVADLRLVFEYLLQTQANYAFPVAEFPSAIQRALKRLADGRMQPFYPEYTITRTQDLEPAYYDAGQFYWGTVSAWLSLFNLHSTGLGIIIPNWRVVDVDTPEDWQRAEIMYKMMLNKEVFNNAT